MIEKIISFLDKKKVNILIVHGLATSNHTHKYIHKSIYKTFKYIQKIYHRKIDVYWIDDIKKTQNLYKNKKNIFLIFSSPHYNTDNFLPILDNAYYILHYRKINFITKKIVTKYDDLLLCNKAVKYIEFRHTNDNKEKINNTVFWYDKNDNSFQIPWATNLLPHEIDVKIDLIKSLKNLPYKSKNSYFCGSIWQSNENEINKWKKICLKYNIKPEFVREKNEKMHQENIRTAYIAPAIQGSCHRTSEDKFYIPCRIFKNISYGNIAVTNNIGVYNLFKDFLIIYDDDLEKLIVKYISYIDSLEDPNNFKKHKEDMVKIMTYVKEHHTYLSRIEILICKLR